MVWTVADLLEFRLAYGWSAEALAVATGYSRSALSHWKAGSGSVPTRYHSRLDRLSLLCRTLSEASQLDPVLIGSLVGAWSAGTDANAIRAICLPGSEGVLLSALLSLI